MAFFDNTDLDNVTIPVVSPELSQDDIVSFDFDLSDEMVDAKPSKLKVFSYWYQDKQAEVYKYFSHHPLIGYSFKRIIYGLITLLIAIILLFLLVRIVTDDLQYLPPNYANLHLSDEQLNQLLISRMKMFGVYGPLGDQLLNYLRNLTPFIPKHVSTDQVYGVDANGVAYIVSEVVITKWVFLGVVSSSSISTPGSDVMELFNKAIPYSFAFGATSVIISYLIGVPLGIQAAKKKDKSTDALINGASVLFVAIPGLVIVLGIYLMSVQLFGNSGMFSSGTFATKFWPVVVLVLMMTPTTVILTRRYVIDEMTSDYTKFAYAKGMGSQKVFYVHIFRNAGIRVLRQFPLDLAVTLFGASILTEQQWGIPGMARYIVAAIGGSKDSFVILGYVSFASFITIFSSLLSDLLMVGMDPRVSLGKK